MISNSLAKLPAIEQAEPGQVDPLEPPIDPNAPMALIPDGGSRTSLMPDMGGLGGGDVEGFDVDRMTEQDTFASNLDSFASSDPYAQSGGNDLYSGFSDALPKVEEEPPKKKGWFY